MVACRTYKRLEIASKTFVAPEKAFRAILLIDALAQYVHMRMVICLKPGIADKVSNMVGAQSTSAGMEQNEYTT